VTLSDLLKPIHLCGNAEGVHNQNRARPRSNRLFHERRIKIESHRVNVHKHRRRADLKHGVRYSYECKRRHDNLAALADAKSKQGQMQPGSAGTDSHCVGNRVISGNGPLEGIEFRAQTQPVRAQHRRHGIDFRACNVRCGKRNANRHANSAPVGTGAGCLISKPSSGTVASSLAILTAAVPSP
jgi:hypothetical protein